MENIRRMAFLISALIPYSDVQISNLEFCLLGFEKDLFLERVEYTRLTEN